MTLPPHEQYWKSPESPKVQSYFVRTKSRSDQEDARLVRTLIAPAYAGKRVLDVGAGPGRMVPVWSECGAILTSCDFSPPFFEVLEKTSREYGQKAIMLDFVRERPPEKYDLVFSAQVLLHIPPSQLTSALTNLKGAAQGDMIFITWQGDAPYDGADSQKVQSFNHDYHAAFAQSGLCVRVELDLNYANSSGGKVFIVRGAELPAALG